MAFIVFLLRLSSLFMILSLFSLYAPLLNLSTIVDYFISRAGRLNFGGKWTIIKEKGDSVYSRKEKFYG